MRERDASADVHSEWLRGQLRKCAALSSSREGRRTAVRSGGGSHAFLRGLWVRGGREVEHARWCGRVSCCAVAARGGQQAGELKQSRGGLEAPIAARAPISVAGTGRRPRLPVHCSVRGTSGGVRVTALKPLRDDWRPGLRSVLRSGPRAAASPRAAAALARDPPSPVLAARLLWLGRSVDAGVQRHRAPRRARGPAEKQQ